MTRARDLAAFVSNADGDIKFDTDTLFIDSSANKVGIRTNTPPHPLSVFGTGAGNATVQIEGESGADPTINFLANNAQHWAIGVDDSDSDTFKISEHSALGTNDYFNIDVSGHVGIGTSSPDTPLHVVDSSTAYVLSETTGTGTSAGFRLKGDASADFTLFTTQGTNQFAIYDNASSAERMRIDSSGNLLVGTSSTFDSSDASNGSVDRFGFVGGRLDVDRNGSAAAAFKRTSSNGTLVHLCRGGSGAVGSISVDTGSAAFNTSSDHRLKENVEILSNGITRVKQLNPKRFSWIVDEEDSASRDGFLAHEAQAVVPEAVTGTHNEVDDDDNPVYQGIDQSKLVPLLTAALKESITKIETLETENTAIKARLDALEA